MAYRGQTFLWPFVLHFLLILRPANSKYLLVTSSAKSYGPDGPWNAFSLKIGSNSGQPIDVYMGGPFSSAIISADICNFSNNTAKASCPARDDGGGVYNADLSDTANTNAIKTTQDGSVSLSYGAGDLLKLTGSTKVMTDRMVIGDGPLLQQSVQNTSINRIVEATHTLPGGGTYDLQVSFLSMGASDLIQSFTDPGKPSINATIPVNQLAANGATGSRSWGMHIGSALLNQPGSLIIGGYDRSRVASDPATFDIKNGGDLEVVLQNITFGVMEGASPWDSTPQGNMLTSDAVTTSPAANSQISVRLSAVPPYLYLPQNTCNEMAKYIPVTFAPSFGLYLWNTSDPKFSLIVNSTAYVQFGFSYRGGGYLIKIPMKLLALELESPFPVTKMTTYFPCRPTTGVSPVYYLGRSFLQGAFLGLSWTTNKFWLAQAPGPAMTTSDIYDINPDDATIAAMADVNWEASWTGVLAVDKSSTSGSGTSNTPASTGGSHTGGIVGGVVGGLAGLLVVAGAVFFIIRRRKQKAPAAMHMELGEPTAETAAKQPLQGPSGYFEADSYAYNPPVELDVGHSRD